MTGVESLELYKIKENKVWWNSEAICPYACFLFCLKGEKKECVFI